MIFRILFFIVKLMKNNHQIGFTIFEGIIIPRVLAPELSSWIFVKCVFKCEFRFRKRPCFLNWKSHSKTHLQNKCEVIPRIEIVASRFLGTEQILLARR